MSPRRKVALFNPIFAHYRGALLRELELRGAHDYYFLADTRDRAWGLATLDLTANPRFTATRCTRLYRNVTWQRGAVSTALRGQHDAIVLGGDPAWLSTWVAGVVARCRGTRVLFWTHGWKAPDRGMKRLIRLGFYRLAHRLLLYGDYAKGIALDMGLDPSRLDVVYNSLDFEQQQRLLGAISEADRVRARTELFGEAGTPAVIATARLTRAKRFDLLIAALGLLVQRGQRVNLLVVGDGPELGALREQARQLGVRATFTGACYDEQALARYFSAAAVCVSPGNIGLTCMHSLGYGVPVITHDDPSDQGPEWEAITPGITGEFFRKNSLEHLAGVIGEWTRQASVDPAVRLPCIRTIAERYHPAAQRRYFDAAISAALP